LINTTTAPWSPQSAGRSAASGGTAKPDECVVITAAGQRSMRMCTVISQTGRPCLQSAHACRGCIHSQRQRFSTGPNTQPTSTQATPGTPQATGKRWTPANAVRGCHIELAHSMTDRQLRHYQHACTPQQHYCAGSGVSPAHTTLLPMHWSCAGASPGHNTLCKCVKVLGRARSTAPKGTMHAAAGSCLPLLRSYAQVQPCQARQPHMGAEPLSNLHQATRLSLKQASPTNRKPTNKAGRQLHCKQASSNFVRMRLSVALRAADSSQAQHAHQHNSQRLCMGLCTLAQHWTWPVYRTRCKHPLNTQPKKLTTQTQTMVPEHTSITWCARLACTHDIASADFSCGCCVAIPVYNPAAVAAPTAQRRHNSSTPAAQHGVLPQSHKQTSTTQVAQRARACMHSAYCSMPSRAKAGGGRSAAALGPGAAAALAEVGLLRGLLAALLLALLLLPPEKVTSMSLSHSCRPCSLCWALRWGLSGMCSGGGGVCSCFRAPQQIDSGVAGTIRRGRASKEPCDLLSKRQRCTDSCSSVTACCRLGTRTGEQGKPDSPVEATGESHASADTTKSTCSSSNSPYCTLLQGRCSDGCW
jgi:hypothetical protein